MAIFVISKHRELKRGSPRSLRDGVISNSLYLVWIMHLASAKCGRTREAFDVVIALSIARNIWTSWFAADAIYQLWTSLDA
jgi:hypothetical protein